MNILLILAIFWPALAGLVIFLMPSCKDDGQLARPCGERGAGG